MNLWTIYMHPTNEYVVYRIEKREKIDVYLAPNNMNDLGWGLINTDEGQPYSYIFDLDKVFKIYEYDDLVKQVRKLYREHKINLLI